MIENEGTSLEKEQQRVLGNAFHGETNINDIITPVVDVDDVVDAVCCYDKEDFSDFEDDDDDDILKSGCMTIDIGRRKNSHRRLRQLTSIRCKDNLLKTSSNDRSNSFIKRKDYRRISLKQTTIDKENNIPSTSLGKIENIFDTSNLLSSLCGIENVAAYDDNVCGDGIAGTLCYGSQQQFNDAVDTTTTAAMPLIRMSSDSSLLRFDDVAVEENACLENKNKSNANNNFNNNTNNKNDSENYSEDTYYDHGIGLALSKSADEKDDEHEENQKAVAVWLGTVQSTKTVHGSAGDYSCIR